MVSDFFVNYLLLVLINDYLWLWVITCIY